MSKQLINIDFKWNNDGDAYLIFISKKRQIIYKNEISDELRVQRVKHLQDSIQLMGFSHRSSARHTTLVAVFHSGAVGQTAIVKGERRGPRTRRSSSYQAAASCRCIAEHRGTGSTCRTHMHYIFAMVHSTCPTIKSHSVCNFRII